MVDSLIAALQPYDIKTPWGTETIRPPLVREALTILASYRDALEDAPVNTGVFFDTLKNWLPDKMVSTMQKSDRAVVVKWVFDIINAGVPAFHKETNGDYEGGGGWTSVVTDYVSVYGYTVDQVMNEKWPVFLMMSASISQVRARGILDTLRAKGLQYTSDDKQRQKEIDALMTEANYPKMTEEAKQRRKDEEQAKNLKRLDAMWPMHKASNMGEA